MTRTQDLTLIGLVSAMFLTNLILIGLIASYAVKVTHTDYRYELLKEDYTRQIVRLEQEREVRLGRIQEQLQGLQFVMDRRFDFIEDQAELRKEEQPEKK